MLKAFQGGSPVLILAVSFIVGAVAGCLIGRPVLLLWVVIPLFMFCLFVLLLLFRRKGAAISVVPACLVVFLYALLGAVAYSIHASVPDKIWPKDKQLWRGSIVSVADTKKTKRCVVAVTSYKDGGRWHRVKGQVLVSMLKGTKASAMSRPGDALLFYARIDKPKSYVLPNGFDYAKWLHRNGIDGTCLVKDRCLLLPAESSERLLSRQPWPVRLQIRCLRFRERLLGQYRLLPANEDDRQVLAALTLGSKSGMNPSIRKLYADTGTSHVLALSGLHLGMLVSLLMLLMRPLMQFRLSRTLVLLLAVVLIWCFAFLTGLSVSLQRSAVMYTLWCIFMCRNRHGQSLNNLALAAILLLVVRPAALLDVGFQLSFLSVLAILGCMPLLDAVFPPRRRGRLVAGFLFISIVAQMATAPLAAYYFNQFPVYFILGNCVAVPCTYLLLSCSVVFFAGSAIPLLQGFAGHILSAVLEMLHGTLSAISRLPLSSLPVRPSVWSVLLVYAVLLAMFLYVRKKCKAAIRVPDVAAL